MFHVLLRWFLFALAIVFISWIIPGIRVENFLSAMFVCIIIALINTFIKPFLEIITLPINILTLGLFSLILNAILLMLAGWIAPGFEIDGFLNALFGSILLSLFMLGINKIQGA
ncbi:phage holin family protein [bacterium]|nr:phage holin family protein [bacterium]